MSTTTNRPDGQARSHRKPKDEGARERTRLFTMEKFDWLDQVNADSRLADGDLKTALAISKCVNEKTRIAFCGVRHIQILTGKSLGAVAASIDRLEANGHLEIIRGGRGRPNHYRMIASVQPAEHFERGECSASRTESTSVRRALDDASGVHSGAGSVRIGGGSVRLAERNTLKEQSQRTPSSSADAGRRGDSVFDDDTSRTTSPNLNASPAAKPFVVSLTPHAFASPSEEMIAAVMTMHGITRQQAIGAMAEAEAWDRQYEQVVALARRVLGNAGDVKKTIDAAFDALDGDLDRIEDVFRRARQARNPRAYIWQCIRNGPTGGLQVIDGGRSGGGFVPLPYDTEQRGRRVRAGDPWSGWVDPGI